MPILPLLPLLSVCEKTQAYAICNANTLCSILQNFSCDACMPLAVKIVSCLTFRIEYKFNLDACGHRDEAQTSVPWENSYWWRTKPSVISVTGLLTKGPMESSLQLQLELYMDRGDPLQTLRRCYRSVIWNWWKSKSQKNMQKLLPEITVSVCMNYVLRIIPNAEVIFSW